MMCGVLHGVRDPRMELFRYANQYPSGIALTAAGRVDVASLVRHHFPLREAEDALQFADEHRGESLKVVVDIGDTD